MSKTPAVLVCDPGTCNLKIAGLTVLDRMVVAAHRAGCEPVVIIAVTIPRLERAEQMGIRVSLEPAPLESALRISGSVLLEAYDLERVIAEGGHLISADGSPLPVEMTTHDPRPVRAQGVAILIKGEASAREADRKFWASLGSTADGVIDRYFNRPLGRFLSKFLIYTPVSPNQISIASILIGAASAPFFAAGNFVVGALILQLCAIVDCVDGELARVLFKESCLGKWLDLAGDQVVHFSVFAAIGIGVARTNPSIPAWTLGASAAIGVLLCFAVIVRAFRQPAHERSPLLNKFLDATANRDFSVLLLALALLGRMDLFLWMAGIGIHVFWIAMLVLQRGRARPAISRETV